jgi:hypothetical protein
VNRSVGQPSTNSRIRRLARRWADRAVRIYAAGALQVAGFATSAGALASTPEIRDDADEDGDESISEAKRRVNTAIETVLLAREIPRSEEALVAAYAARAALALADQSDPTAKNLKHMVDAIHAASLSSVS